MKFLQTLLIILIIIVTIRLLWRYFGKAILKWLGMKAMQRVQKSFEKRAGFQGQQNPFQNPNAGSKSSSKENAPFKSNENKKVGEYIDFEEID
ncbi:MAG: DUF4834 family protein [Nonlabens sp.]|uniref:DUF4834 family protein n=1 Tax=Nonlabens sp. TaxID=1888209 RepID=UPI00321BDC75